ncbi:uncharacterized protein LOC110456348 [Mizuhopecten yessoensis]|uniref:Uncharacterized protein n=1 Tax=Mizuhopecten yessoensis TaxID=6573 RepID=A0A210QB72_MIZYE|nr:uncharacterized protein LOC110456348 [Mizuhopecten yessoensis]XP_021362705.1 uncharacterized protein LOC110456348 [Mizuhopecten yessoensis]XP_021362706.1 uncharacterized protein LOC110456348 [Mizuhopecten yessoensis]OWF45976.1 hypothetical protein KP79_PYT08014 [Mizuhopecten yessoensis]
MDTTNTDLEERPSHRLEVRDKGSLASFREGPFIGHNTLVTHAEFLKVANYNQEPRVFRLLPVGGASNFIGDVFSLIIWYFMCVYSCCVIPIACYCDNTVINIANAAVLCVLLMYYIIGIYTITRNKTKLKRMLCVAETTADRYQGYQNYFFEVGSNNTEQLTFLNMKHRKKLRQEIVIRKGKGMVVMLCARSYWRSRIIYPIICLAVLSLFNLIGVIVQLETMKRVKG